jgi:hypothetical protein
MSSHKTYKFKISQNLSETLEDIRLLLNVNDLELFSALSLLERTQSGHMRFNVKNIEIEFGNSSFSEIFRDAGVETVISEEHSLTLKITIEEEKIKRSVEYQIPKSVLTALDMSKKPLIRTTYYPHE